jgi:hypothetical protein
MSLAEEVVASNMRNYPPTVSARMAIISILSAFMKEKTSRQNVR